jgi:two-component system cell cycle sensor histidine kinase/response regulator CckA
MNRSEPSGRAEQSVRAAGLGISSKRRARSDAPCQRARFMGRKKPQPPGSRRSYSGWLSRAFTCGELVVLLWTCFPILRLLSAQPDARELPALTRTEQIRHLSLEQISRGAPVRFEGIVTYSDPDNGFVPFLVVQDATGGVGVVPRSNQIFPEAGQRVIVEGTAEAGKRLPFVNRAILENLGPAPMPTPSVRTISELFSGDYDNIRVEVRGTIRSVVERNGRLELDVASGSQRASVLIRQFSSADTNRLQLLDAEVRVTGTCVMEVDAQKKIADALIFLPRLNGVTIEKPGQDNVFGLPISAIASITNLTVPPAHRLRVQGTIAEKGANGSFGVRDATGTIQIRTELALDARVGDQFDAAGYLTGLPAAPLLDYSVARLLGRPPVSTSGSTNAPTGRETPNWLPLLTTAKQVRSLSADEAKRGYPVRLRGVVTYLNFEWPSLFIQDETAGIYIHLNAGSSNLNHANIVEVEGFSYSGRFSPVVMEPRIRVLGSRSLPVPVKASLETLASGRLDSQWVETRGVVRSATNIGKEIQVELAQDGLKTKVWVSGVTPGQSLTNYIDAAVLVHGVSAIQFDEKRRMVGFNLFAPNPDQIKLEKAPPEAPFDIPERSIARMLRFTLQANDGHRVKVTGVVTLQRPGKLLFIEDETGSLQIESRQTGRIEVGDRVEVIGFPALRDFTPILEDGLFRRLGMAGRPEPVPVSAKQALNLDFHGRLIRLKGQLLDSTLKPDARVLVLQGDEIMFPAFMDPAWSPNSAVDLRAGSLLEVTGICLLDPNGAQPSTTFRVLLRSPEDVAVLKSPPWWTLKHTAGAIGGLTAVIVSALSWVVLLRRRVGTQTELIRQRLEAEAALEEQYRELFENATDIVYTHDLQGNFTSINRAAENILGYTHAELLSLNGFQIVAPEYRQLSSDMLKQKLTTGAVTTYEMEFLTKDGRRIWVDVSTRLVVQNGEPISVHGVARDITARKRAQEALRVSEERFRKVFQGSPVGIALVGADFRLIQANGALCDMLGYTQVELVGKSFTEITHPDDVDKDISLAEKVFKGEIPNYRMEKRYLHKAGGNVWVTLTATVVRDQNGKPLYGLGMVEDVTERRRTQETLQTHAQVLESMAEGVALCAEDQTIVLTNPAFDAMFGYKRGELAGQPISILNCNSPDEVSRMAPAMLEQLAKKEVWQGEFKSLKKDGARFLTACRMSALELSGKPYVISVQQDISERRKAEIRSGALSNLGHRLSAARSPKQAADIIIEVAERLFGWDACYLHLFTWNHEVVIPIIHFDTIGGKRVVALAGYSDLKPTATDLEILGGGKKLVLRDQPSFESSSRLIPFGDTSRPSASLMYVPVRNGPEPIGVLSIQSYTPRAYDEEDLETLQGLADHCGGALERMRNAEAFEQSERHYRALIDNSSDGISLVASDGTILYASPTVTRILGYSVEENVGSNAFDRIHPDDLNAARRQFQEVIRQPGGMVTAQFRTRHKNGNWLWVEGTGKNLLDNPSVGAVVLNYRDITERKHADEALRQSEWRFSKAFQATPVSIAISTLAEGQLVDVNDVFLQLFSFSRAEVIGRTALDLGIWIAPEQRAEIIQLLRDQRPVRNRECSLRTKAGNVLDTLISAEIINFGNQPCTLFITYDLSERLRLEAQLRHSQKMEAVGQLAAGIAHDFNNIMTIIQGHASLLLSSALPERDAAESLKKVSVAAERAASLTRQLLTFSRKQVMQPRLLDLGQIVSSVSRMLQRLLGETILLECHYAPDSPAIYADAGMMEQIILNLAVNARDAMPKGGKLTISISTLDLDDAAAHRNAEARPGRFVCLTVRDTGCGMDAATLGKIFEPFFTTKEIGKGTGLGLSMVYGIIKQHRGWIEVASELERGTTFEIYFPAESKPAEATGMTVPNGPVLQAGSETILVVEDEHALRQLVTYLLRQHGYNVIEARSGREALQLWRQHDREIDLLLTDIVMPEGISGVDLTEELQSEKPSLKVIYTSGYSQDVAGQRVVLEEGVNFLPKPYHPPKLAQIVRDRLDS